MTLGDFEFTYTTYDKGILLDSRNESPFIGLGVELLKELGIFITILGYSSTRVEGDEPAGWTRNEAILAGLLIRCSKLQMGYLDNICQMKMEIVNVIGRSLAETAVNLIYLLKKSTVNLFDEYVEYSLRHEKKLYVTIEHNIAERGYELPIESRMKRSIDGVFSKSGIGIESVNTKNQKTWGGSIRNRFESIGYGKIYDVIMGGGSHYVHGNWEELLEHHLKYDDGVFKPKDGWKRPRPQLLYAMGGILGSAAIEYINHVLPECQEKTALTQMLDDLANRFVDVDEIHEEWLNRDN